MSSKSETSGPRGEVPARPALVSAFFGGPLFGFLPFGGRPWGSGWAQAALPAVHWLHDMFQPLRPLSGAMVVSGECLTVTTSPTSELS